MLYNQDDQALEFAQASLAFYKIDNPLYAGVVSLALDDAALSTRTARASLAQREAVVDIYSSIRDVPDYLPLIKDTQSQMNVGLMDRDKRLLGVLVLESSRENDFLEDDRALVKGIAQQISIAIDRAAESAILRFKTTVASRTSWAAELAHDANKEISYIRNRTYWITEQARDLEEAHQYAREIDASAERLASTIQNDLETRGRGVQPFVLDNAVKQWLQEIVTDRFPDIDVVFDCDCAGEAIHAQQEMLKRTVRHVLRNAVEAMKRKGTITCSIRKTPAGEFEIQISDTGPGIAEEMRQILGREPITTKGETGGYGLLLVRSILEDMGGSLHIARSSPGEGATVILHVPARSKKIDEERLAAGV
jgi:signal transduction histidine kinase